MQLNVRKIDAHLQKLQEIRRIASDPELVSMLMEFIADDHEAMWEEPPAQAQAVAAPSASDLDIVDHVLKGKDPHESSLWPRKRA